MNDISMTKSNYKNRQQHKSMTGGGWYKKNK